MDFVFGLGFFAFGVLATLLIVANRFGKRLRKVAKKKSATPWMTRNQMEVLDSIRKHGRRGVPLWFTDIALSTIRSLAKRGFVDTRRRGRVVATRAGKRRLSEPWPAPQPTGDQKERNGVEGSTVTEIDPAPSGGHVTAF